MLLLLIMHIESHCARGNIIILIFKVTEISKGAALTVWRIMLTQRKVRQGLLWKAGYNLIHGAPLKGH